MGNRRCLHPLHPSFLNKLTGLQAGSNMMLANLTLDFAQDYEAIIDMDDFAGLVQSIDCTAPDLNLEFKSEEAFLHAKDVWGWANTVSQVQRRSFEYLRE